MNNYNPVIDGNKYLIPTDNTDSQHLSYLKGTLDGLLLCEGLVNGLETLVFKGTVNKVKRQIMELESKYSSKGVF